MELERFSDQISQLIMTHDFNYEIEDVCIINNVVKNIYIVTLNYKEGKWPPPTIENYELLRRKIQSFSLPNYKYMNTYLLTSYTGNGIQIWFI
ncbi:hypothetical protein Yalta_055 [Yalta virus]|nr:hypothetical protein Yalta_055 [Yalta virus]